MRTIVAIVAALSAMFALAGAWALAETSVTPTTCATLTAETLDMTGPDATQPYDVEKVRDINNQRDILGC